MALLNIINNIPGLDVGDELNAFREGTQDMDPISRGDAVNGFEFVRRIHNSFASESDMLNANMHLKIKAERANKRQASIKAKASKAVRRIEQAGLEKPVATSVASRRSSRVQGLPNSDKSNLESAILKSDDDGDYAGVFSGQQGRIKTSPRRSARKRRPNQHVVDSDKHDADESCFHFVAYMPIKSHVWRMDGLDFFPQDMGSFTCGGASVQSNHTAGGFTANSWLDIVQPSLMGRMSQSAGADLSYNLMAVVQNPVFDMREDFTRNIKAIHAIDAKLDEIMKGWQELAGAETKGDVVTSSSLELDITQAHLDAAKMAPSLSMEITSQDDGLKLITLRQSIIAHQMSLRAAIREAMAVERADEDEVRHSRHDYTGFVRSWLSALAEIEMLGDLLNS